MKRSVVLTLYLDSFFYSVQVKGSCWKVALQIKLRFRGEKSDNQTKQDIWVPLKVYKYFEC